MGKISRIQLRGISRTPSDRMTSDGGCAESLNAYLQDSEIAPALVPDDVTDIVGSSATFKAKRIFIHKGANYENYILHLDQNNQIGLFINGTFKAFLTLDSDETLSDITSVGNTVIIATSKRINYVLYTNKEYRFLGNRIPEPLVEFQCTPSSYTYRTSPINLLTGGDATANAINRLDESAWATAIDRLEQGSTEDANGWVTRLIDLQNQIWATANKRIKEAKFNKAFVCPFLIRYAIQLYDGSYIYQSVPILLGAGNDKFLEVTADKYTASDGKINSSISLTLTKAFVAKAYLRTWQTEGWNDIIRSVDLFVSTDICYPNINSNVSELKFDSSSDAGSTVHDKYTIAFQNGNVSDLKAMESEILSKSLFYKIASFGVNDNSQLSQGFNIIDADIDLSEDKLVIKDRLPDYEQSGIEIMPSSLYSYNGRLLAAGDKKKLPTGYSYLQSTNILPNTYPNNQTYIFAFYVTGNDGVERKILSRAEDGGYLMSTYSAKVSDAQGSATVYAMPYGLIFFPDSRCTKVSVWDSTDVYQIEMKPHPFLNCSYAFWGLSKTLQDMSNAIGDVTQSSFVSGENRLESDANKLYVSEAGNPFYFPISGNMVMSANILGIAIAATTLSQGQFGQFPLYVFTEEGIWVMETASDGSFISSKPLSREVCSNPASITPLDQAVVFISAKGVMLLEGSQITELSSNMNGKHYRIEDVARTIIEGTTYSSLLPAATDSDPFLYFMKDAKIAYDYSGKRLIFISASNQGYQYVYKLDTNTWHKLTLGLNLLDPINSYPDCLITGTDGTHTKIYDLSTLLDVADADKKAAKMLIATRPFDLEEPDVYKTITAVRIRGQYAAGAVKFILQGSHDGINFYTINTLRGKSWKLFRLIILANLAPTERISWIDVEYETRFTNKLR